MKKHKYDVIDESSQVYLSATNLPKGWLQNDNVNNHYMITLVSLSLNIVMLFLSLFGSNYQAKQPH